MYEFTEWRNLSLFLRYMLVYPKLPKMGQIRVPHFLLLEHRRVHFYVSTHSNLPI